MNIENPLIGLPYNAQFYVSSIPKLIGRKFINFTIETKFFPGYDMYVHNLYANYDGEVKEYISNIK